VLDSSSANNPKMPDRQRLQIEQIRTWVTALYAPHDCSQLGKRYEVPAPPPIFRKKG
jgi:hypothetical protein